MASIKKKTCQKRAYQKVSFDMKLRVLDEIHNGLISINHASKTYGISRSSITYWRDKLSSFVQTQKSMSKNDEIKKLKAKIEELEFIKDFQQDVIADLENITNYPDHKLIETADIPNLKVINPNGIEIKGTNINGMDRDVFEITILGVSYPLYKVFILSFS